MAKIIYKAKKKLTNKEFLKNVFIFASIAIVVMSVIVRIIMYIKCRSLWLDEAALAENIVMRNWLELLATPLINLQSAPALYLIVVKAIGSIFGYTEGSLRIFSFFAFIGLLICEVIFLKKIFNFSNCKICFVVVMSALLPSYIWYSNELKPYMSDVFFVLLTILLYFYYTQNKIRLPVLTVLYILILGFSSPSVFFIGGTLSFEFVSAVLNKNKKQVLYIAISGITILAIFALYYHWWMQPVAKDMKIAWGNDAMAQSIIRRIVSIFSCMRQIYSNIFVWGFVWFFVPFALLGIYSLCKSKNKIAWSVVLSLSLAFLASSIGKWPLACRLWLFLPAIVFIFTPIGADIILNKAKNKKIMSAIGFFFIVVLTLSLSVNCLEFTRHRMYFPRTEINHLISYVQENIKNDEKLYVYADLVVSFRYKNGYNATKIGNATDNNIIYGRMSIESETSVDIQSILENKKTYLLIDHFSSASHFDEFQKWLGLSVLWKYGILIKPNPVISSQDREDGLAVLRKYGTLTKIMNVYDTYLYYFERNAD